MLSVTGDYRWISLVISLLGAKNSCKHFGFVHWLTLGGACVCARAMVWHRPSKTTRKFRCIPQGLDVGVIWGSPKQTTNPCCISLTIPAGKSRSGLRSGNKHPSFVWRDSEMPQSCYPGCTGCDSHAGGRARVARFGEQEPFQAPRWMWAGNGNWVCLTNDRGSDRGSGLVSPYTIIRQKWEYIKGSLNIFSVPYNPSPTICCWTLGNRIPKERDREWDLLFKPQNSHSL